MISGIFPKEIRLDWFFKTTPSLDVGTDERHNTQQADNCDPAMRDRSLGLT
jgi:hypothetical protein